MSRAARALAITLAALVVAATAPAAASEVSADEQQFIYELNRARSDPAGYAAEALAAGRLSPSVAELVATFPVMPPLAANEVVANAAQLRSDDMADDRYFAHFNPTTGFGPPQALAEVGYQWWGWGENIGLGYPSALSMLDGFLSSNLGHRESVMGVTGSGNKEIGVGFVGATGDPYYRNLWTAILTRPNPDRVYVTGVVYVDGNGNGRMDLGEGVPRAAVTVGGVTTTSNDGGGWAVAVTPGASLSLTAGSSASHITVGTDNVSFDITLEAVTGPPPCPPGAACDGVTVVDSGGRWHRRQTLGGSADSFFFGNPGDVAFTGDWDCDGESTPGLFRRSDGFVYLRNSNTQGIADVEFFFGNPGDLPIAGDFDGDGCDTVGIYRPAESRIFVIDDLGEDGAGLGAAETAYVFGDPGDQPFVGDFDGDGIDTVGLHRESTGLVYFRNSHGAGFADSQFVFGDPGDVILAGDWDGDGVDTVGVYRPATGMVHLSDSNAAGTAAFAMQVGSNHVAAAAS